jgi:hypothetical protein
LDLKKQEGAEEDGQAIQKYGLEVSGFLHAGDYDACMAICTEKGRSALVF